MAGSSQLDLTTSLKVGEVYEIGLDFNWSYVATRCIEGHLMDWTRVPDHAPSCYGILLPVVVQKRSLVRILD